MEQREKILKTWFSMWLRQDAAGMEEIFAPDAVYIESWGPEYHGLPKIRHWFEEWNTRGVVERWDIHQFFHKDSETIVQWTFRSRMHDGRVEAFEGLTRAVWNEAGQIVLLQEYGCNESRYDPYQNGPEPQFRDEPIAWF